MDISQRAYTRGNRFWDRALLGFTETLLFGPYLSSEAGAAFLQGAEH